MKDTTSRITSLALVGTMLALTGCSTTGFAAETPQTQSSSQSQLPDAARLALGTKATYQAPAEDIEYSEAPDEFEPVLLEHVARHGSRLLSSKKYDDLITQLWEMAKSENGLTETGQRLGPVVAEITAVHEQVGYGNLSVLGQREHRDMAERAYERMEDLFEEAEDDELPINVATSGVDRAVDSAQNFVQGLTGQDDDLAEVIGEPVAKPDVLYFHDTDEAYNDFVDNDPLLAETLDKVEADPEIQQVARRVVGRLFTEEFIAKLDSGAIDLVDRGKGKKHLQSVVDAAMYLYELYVIAPGMADEHPIDFSQFLTNDDALVLSRVSEAEDFYEKGPSFAGSDVTYRMADVLLSDMLDAVTGVRTGETTQAADFRFAHAEEIIPLAALLQLPGSTTAQPADSLFSYENNDWRGAQVAPMGSNIQWDVYANDDHEVLVRMLYNEREIPFGFDCEPIEEGSFFYADTELRRCLGDLVKQD
ncbi:histidine-type phosphatase [Glutamicibacter sp. X7]